MSLRDLQTRLKVAGYEPGPIDGMFGPKTLGALLDALTYRRNTDYMMRLAPPLAVAMNAGLINTPDRIARFLATLYVESAGFSRTEENLNYSAGRLLKVFPSRVKSLAQAERLVAGGAEAIANCVYAGKNGNGDEASGDGYRFRGRTEGQLTGRANYRQMGLKLRLPLEADPDMATAPEISAQICVRFWSDRSLNSFADHGDDEAIRVRWNGPAMEGLSDVRKVVTRILTMMGE